MLSKFSVKRPYTVLVGVLLILILGFVSVTKMTTDLLPSMNLPYAVVYTTYIGASPEEVETTVTRPVESSMATISNIKNIQSVSSENVSMVILEFEQTANMDSVTIEMWESLDQISASWSDSIGSPDHEAEPGYDADYDCGCEPGWNGQSGADGLCEQ